MDKEAIRETQEIQASGDAIIISEAINGFSEAIHELARSISKLADAQLSDLDEGPKAQEEQYLS